MPRITNLVTTALFLAILCICTGPHVAHAQQHPRLGTINAKASERPVLSVTELESRFSAATALLYAMDGGGSYRMLCTATAFEREGKTYRFVTAAHCLSEDNVSREKVEVETTSFFITFDRKSEKLLHEARVVAAGYQHNGDDLAVVEVKLGRTDYPIMPLAERDPRLGENVINFASPLGLGKQLFRGHVSMANLDRPVVSDSINWHDAALLQMSVGPGSSGSSVVSVEQGGIVAFIVGEIGMGGRGSPNIVAIPVSKFKTFWSNVKKGKYQYYKQPTGKEKRGAATSKKPGDPTERLWRRIHGDGQPKLRFEDDPVTKEGSE